MIGMPYPGSGSEHAASSGDSATRKAGDQLRPVREPRVEQILLAKAELCMAALPWLALAESCQSADWDATVSAVSSVAHG